MEIEYLSETRQKHHSHAYYQMHHEAHELHKNHNRRGDKQGARWLPFLAKVNTRPGLKILFIASAVILLFLVIALIVILYPVIMEFRETIGTGSLLKFTGNTLKG